MKYSNVRTFFLGLFLLFALVPIRGFAQQQEVQQIANLEVRISELEHRFPYHQEDGFVLFMFGVFCALWAQNTRRNPWLWFFLGLFFNVLTVLVLLYKNAKDKRQKT